MTTLTSLTAREQIFTQQFAARGNAVGAAEAAGYPAEQALTVAQTLLDQPHIKEQLHVLALTHGLSEPEATLQLTQLARGTMAPFLRVGGDGQVHVDLTTDQAKAHYHLLRRVVQRRHTTHTAAGPVEVIETEIELHDAVSAVDKLLQLHGAYPATYEVSGCGELTGTNIYLPDNGRDDMLPTRTLAQTQAMNSWYRPRP
ncbi:MAG: terminase small subunit [Janthinobacterium lividum]